MVVLTAFAIFGLIIYLFKVIYALRLMAHGVPLSHVSELLNPLSPFQRMLQAHALNLNNTIPNAPAAPIATPQPPEVSLPASNGPKPIYPQLPSPTVYAERITTDF